MSASPIRGRCRWRSKPGTLRPLGQPGSELALAQLVLYLASTAKSNAAYVAFNAAKHDVHEHGTQEVPMHLRMRDQTDETTRYSKGYQYDHDAEGGVALGQPGFRTRWANACITNRWRGDGDQAEREAGRVARCSRRSRSEEKLIDPQIGSIADIEADTDDRDRFG